MCVTMITLQSNRLFVDNIPAMGTPVYLPNGDPGCDPNEDVHGGDFAPVSMYSDSDCECGADIKAFKMKWTFGTFSF